MSTVISCPSCHGEVSLPPDATPVLICPLCQAEFTLQPVLADPAPASSDDPAEYAESVADEAPHAESSEDTEAAEAHSFQIDTGGPQPTDAHSVGIDTGEQSREDAHAVGIDDGQAASASTATKAKNRAKRHGPGALGHLIGIVGGGFIGLSVGYVILTLISPRYNFLNVSLPWIEQAEAPEGNPPEVRQPQPRRAGGAPRVAGNGSRRPAGGGPRPPAAGPELFSADQLGDALGAANAAVGCETCSSRGYVIQEEVVGTREFNGRTIELKRPVRRTCEACGGNPSAEITPAVYAKLCYLAHVVTNVNPRDAGVYDRRKAVEIVLAKATDTQPKVNRIVQLAAGRLDDRARPDPGVLLVANVQKLGQQGPWQTIEMVLLGNPRTVVVVTPGPPGVQPGENVIIAGSIVEDPSARLDGYRGREPLVVRGGMRLDLKAAP